MDIPKARKQFDRASKDLSRARRLYKYLIYRELLRNPDMIYICAQRAKSRGLYATKTSYSDVCWSLARGVQCNVAAKNDELEKARLSKTPFVHAYNVSYNASKIIKNRVTFKPRLKVVA